MNKKYLKSQHQLFFICFTLASWLLFSALFMNQVIFDFLYELQLGETSLSNNFNKRKIPMIITSPNIKKKESEEKIERVYMSNKSFQAQGKLTKRKGFQWLSEQDQLKLESFQKASQIKSQMKDDVLMVKIFKKKSILWKKHKKRYSRLTQIPASYNFDYKRALSWNRDGTPQIPTYLYKEYKYIKSMGDSIHNYWILPGGSPKNLYQYDYYKNYYVPGYVRIRIFPPQKIALMFMLNELGEVLDVKIQKSLGYQVLNESLIEAIYSIKNFGIPPKSFIKSNRVIFSWLLQLY